jgi:hypothetical protein
VATWLDTVLAQALLKQQPSLRSQADSNPRSAETGPAVPAAITESRQSFAQGDPLELPQAYHGWMLPLRLWLAWRYCELKLSLARKAYGAGQSPPGLTDLQRRLAYFLTMQRTVPLGEIACLPAAQVPASGEPPPLPRWSWLLRALPGYSLLLVLVVLSSTLAQSALSLVRRERALTRGLMQYSEESYQQARVLAFQRLDNYVTGLAKRPDDGKLSGRRQAEVDENEAELKRLRAALGDAFAADDAGVRQKLEAALAMVSDPQRSADDTTAWAQRPSAPQESAVQSS